MDLARQYTWDQVMERLRAAPELVNAQPSGRWSALHQAAQAGSVRAVKVLLRFGANPLALTKDGQTPRAVAPPAAADVQRMLEVAEAGGKVVEPQPRTYDQNLARMVAESGRPGRAQLLARRPHSRRRWLSAELQNVGEASGKLRRFRTF